MKSRTVHPRKPGGSLSQGFQNRETEGANLYGADATDHFFINFFGNFNPNNMPQYQSEASLLGFDLNVPRMAVLIHLDGFCENCLESPNVASFEREDMIRKWKGRVEGAVNGFFTKNQDIITAYVGEGKFLVLKSAEGTGEEMLHMRLQKAFNAIFGQLKVDQVESITVGFSNSYDGIKGLAEACAEANIALNLGMRLGRPNESYYFDDFGIMYTLAEGDIEKKVSLANKILAPLASEDLLKTLTNFLKYNLSIKKTADKLGVHRNTVIYRLGQIADKVGLDPRNFDEAVKIKMALMIKQMSL